MPDQVDPRLSVTVGGAFGGALGLYRLAYIPSPLCVPVGIWESTHGGQGLVTLG